MNIVAIDLVSVGHARPSRSQVGSTMVPDRDVSIMVKVKARTSAGETLSGLGEIRALKSLTGESQRDAFDFAGRLAWSLRGAEIDEGLEGRAAARAAEALVGRHVKEACGISHDRRLPRAVHPAVRFGFDSAILDLMARQAGRSVLRLLGGAPKSVPLNVLSVDFANPVSIIGAMRQPSRSRVWLRGRFNGIGAATRDVFTAVDVASAASDAAIEGIWFGLGGDWSYRDFEGMLGEMQDPVRTGVRVMVEQPFAPIADAYYRAAFAAADAGGWPLRFMVEDAVGADASVDAYLGSADLRVTPQVFGSVHGVLERLDAVREAGFRGGVYLGNAGRNTAFNTLVLVTLAQLLPDVQYFSARPVVRRNLRQVHPQSEVVAAGLAGGDGEAVVAPEGLGWATNLARSVLRTRLFQTEFVREAHVAGVDQHVMTEELILEAFEDALLAIDEGAAAGTPGGAGDGNDEDAE